MQNVVTTSIPGTKACSIPLCISHLVPRKDNNDGHQARHEHDGQGCEACTPPPGLAVSRPARVCYRHAGWSRRAMNLCLLSVCRVGGVCRECGRTEFDLQVHGVGWVGARFAG